ncbi:MAG: transposase [Erysipelotrichaceae bacterium]|nr:transposase [Erysipelotrichaceae bacterium]
MIGRLTSILSEIGDINIFTDYRQVINYADVAPLVYKSSQYKTEHAWIT